jgi:hypothetical protein
MVACHWKRLSPIGPAEHDEGGSRPRSINSYRVSYYPRDLQRQRLVGTYLVDSLQRHLAISSISLRCISKEGVIGREEVNIMSVGRRS